MKLSIKLVFYSLGLHNAAQLSKDFLEEVSVQFSDLTLLSVLGQLEKERLGPPQILTTVNLTKEESEEG